MPPYYQAIKYSNYIFITRLLILAIVFLILYIFHHKNRKNFYEVTIYDSIKRASFVYFTILIPRIIATYVLFQVNLKFHQTMMNNYQFFMRIIKIYTIEFVSYIFIVSIFLYFFEKYGNFGLRLGIVLSIFTMVIMFLYPIVIRPLFFHARVVKSEELKSDVKKLSQTFKVDIEKIYVIDASRYTKASNAYVFGLFSTLQIVVYDNLLKKFPKREVLAIIAHEISHYKLNHLYLMLFATILFLLFGFTLVERLFNFDRKKSDNIKFSHLVKSDIYRFLLISFIVMQFLNILGHYIERHGEAEADRCAVKTTGMKKELILSLQHLYLDSLDHPSPNPILKILFYTHFPPKERISMINSIQLPCNSSRK